MTGLSTLPTSRLMVPRELLLGLLILAHTNASDAMANCDERAAHWAQGQFARSGVVERAQRDAGARTVRVIGPDDAVTLEHNPQRLNVEVDAANRIVNLRCG
jgi:hypothetical protein